MQRVSEDVPTSLKKSTHEYILDPTCSMYGIFTNIDPINDPNVGKYSIHGASRMGSNISKWRSSPSARSSNRYKSLVFDWIDHGWQGLGTSAPGERGRCCHSSQAFSGWNCCTCCHQKACWRLWSFSSPASFKDENLCAFWNSTQFHPNQEESAPGRPQNPQPRLFERLGLHLVRRYGIWMNLDECEGLGSLTMTVRDGLLEERWSFSTSF